MFLSIKPALKMLSVAARETTGTWDLDKEHIKNTLAERETMLQASLIKTVMKYNLEFKEVFESVK